MELTAMPIPPYNDATIRWREHHMRTRTSRIPAAAGLTLLMGTCAALAAPPGPLPYGSYDPGGYYEQPSAEVTIEHIFLPWEDVSLDSLAAADRYALERNRALMITIEPWTWSRDERNTPDYLRNGIASGQYDANMRAVCEVIGTLQSPVSVRWGQEMDYEDGQFIWSGWAPEDYISAYRRMIGICREEAPRINAIWSPLGLEGMERYYPGDNYVDLVGLSIFGYQDYEEGVLGRALSFEELLTERYARAAQFNKPVVVAELGYTGDAAYVADWENSVRQPQPDMPNLVGVVYFNQQEVYPWPNGFGFPDWRIDSRVTGEPVVAAAQTVQPDQPVEQLAN